MKVVKTLPLDYRNLLITCAVGGAALAYAFLLFLPTQKSIRQLNDELQQKQNYISQTSTLDQNLKDVNQRLTEAQRYNQKWQATAPAVDQVSATFANVTLAASRAGVKTMHFDPQPVERMALISRVPVLYGFRGGFVQVFDMLAQLESMPETIWIEDLELTRTAEVSEEVQCEITFAVFADNHEISN